MDSTQALIDKTRSSVRFYPFNRPKFWVRFWFNSTIIVLSAGAVAFMLNFLYTHRTELREVLSVF